MTLAEITDVLQEWFTERTGAPVDPDRHYAELNELDSFDVMELVLFTEKTFGFRFTGSDFASAGFATLSGLATLVHSKPR